MRGARNCMTIRLMSSRKNTEKVETQNSLQLLQAAWTTTPIRKSETVVPEEKLLRFGVIKHQRACLNFLH